MAPGMKASGKRVKLVDRAGSSTPMVTAMREYGAMVKLVAKEYMYMLMVADTLASFMPIIRTALEGKSGRMEPCLKVNY